ncbi:hypothetical protein CJI61_12645 [Brucella melitensis]|nr:hypothetical protein CJI61_12645 [Brucella melitensis]
MIDPWRGVAPCGPAKNQKSAMTCRHSRQLSDMPLSIVCAGDKRQQDSGKAFHPAQPAPGDADNRKKAVFASIS